MGRFGVNVLRRVVHNLASALAALGQEPGALYSLREYVAFRCFYSTDSTLKKSKEFLTDENILFYELLF